MISSPPEWASYKDAPIRGGHLKRWLKSRFRYVDYPFLQGFRGFGNSDYYFVQGHVFRGMAMAKPRRRTSAFKNFISLVKMFLVRTIAGAKVELHTGKGIINTTTTEDGFFEFKVFKHNLNPGWHTVMLRLGDELVEGQEEVSVKVKVFIGRQFDYGCISDIDDTFLVSHVTKAWRKLYLLTTKDPETRKPFKGVVQLYQELRGGSHENPNPFFYVSSSEWNLYDFLLRFIEFNDLPRGVLQLKQIKDSFTDFFKSGYGSHDHKRIKVQRILEMYPDQQFILLGDNGQHDPHIYYRIVRENPGRIKAIYIRAVKRSHKKRVNQIVEKIMALDIPILQFKHSADARKHAREHGFI